VPVVERLAPLQVERGHHRIPIGVYSIPCSVLLALRKDRKSVTILLCIHNSMYTYINYNSG
jgi:hypothetical protein